MNFASVLQGFVAILWIAVIGLIIVAIVRAARGYKVRSTKNSISRWSNAKNDE